MDHIQLTGYILLNFPCQTVFWEEDKLDEAMDELKATIRNAFPGETKEED